MEKFGPTLLSIVLVNVIENIVFIHGSETENIHTDWFPITDQIRCSDFINLGACLSFSSCTGGTLPFLLSIKYVNVAFTTRILPLFCF